MTVGTEHPAVTAYLARLDAAAAAALPPGRREELLAEIPGHLADAVRDVRPDDESAVRDVLDRLGAPEDIVSADADGDLPRPLQGAVIAAQAPPSPWGTLEVIAVVALTAGTFLLPILGPIVGIVLVWASARWTRGEKSIATLLTLLPLVAIALGAAVITVSAPSGGDEPVPFPSPVLTSGVVP